MKTIPNHIKSGMTVYMVMPCPYIKGNIGIEETRLRAADYAPHLECSINSFFDLVTLQKANWMNSEQLYFIQSEAFKYANSKYPNHTCVEITFKQKENAHELRSESN